MEFEHIPVLLNETIDSLAIKPNGIYVDGTLGGAGHSYHICEHLGYNSQKQLCQYQKCARGAWYKQSGWDSS